VQLFFSRKEAEKHIKDELKDRKTRIRKDDDGYYIDVFFMDGKKA